MVKLLSVFLLTALLVSCGQEKAPPNISISEIEGDYRYTESSGRKLGIRWAKNYWELNIKDGQSRLTYYDNDRGIKGFALSINLEMDKDFIRVHFDSIIASGYISTLQIKELKKGDILLTMQIFDNGLTSNFGVLALGRDKRSDKTQFHFKKVDNPTPKLKTRKVDSLVRNGNLISHLNTEKSKEPAKQIAPVGTQILPNSARTKSLWELTAYDLTSVSFTNCASEGEEIYHTKYPIINEVSRTDSTLIIYFNISDDCGSSFLCEAELVGNSINLIYHQFDAYTSCSCCYGLKYHFDIIREQIMEGDTKIKFITINGKDKTKIKG